MRHQDKLIMFAAVFGILCIGSCQQNSTKSASKTVIGKKNDTVFDNGGNIYYVGFERNTDMDSQHKEKWYTRLQIRIKQDSVFLETSPITITNKDTLYSSSDGGFFHYSGKFRQHTPIVIELRETSCDNCGEPIKENADGTYSRIYRKIEFTGHVVDNGELILNNIVFERMPKNKEPTMSMARH